jgi:tRNA-specific 2-thiouridylase
LEDAAAVARTLKIEFRVVDLIDQYRERIVDYLLEGYRAGVTPNPDVLCNRERKFGVFLDYALSQGVEAVATGHYARRREREDGTADILRGVDPNKDQSYFLALMTQRQARHALFPVGGMLKPEVRATAARYGIPTAGKKDSQGICFIGNVKMSEFLRHYVPDSPGEIVDLDGRVVGTHRGLHLYTLGQRKGHGVASAREGMAYVVVAKDIACNRLIVGWDECETPGLYARECTVISLSAIAEPLAGRSVRECDAQPRYRCKAERVTVEADGIRLKLHFHTPQRALTPGQICAFYEGERLLGGGVFETITVD